MARSRNFGIFEGLNDVGVGSHKTRSAKRRPIDKNLRSIVWHKYFKDKMIGKCYVCSKPVTYDNFEVGHNKAVAKGGSNNINNLRVICKSCNRAMGTMSIEVYKRKYFTRKRAKPKKAKKRNYHYEYNMLTGRREKVRNSKGIW